MLLHPICAKAQWQGYLIANIDWAKISGYSQIPKGGTVGSSSFERPSFQELSITQAFFYELGLGIKYHDYYMQLDYIPLQVHSNTVLTETLITHARTIPAGSPFSANILYQWFIYHLGKDFHFAKWTLSPEIQANYLRYGYHFSSPLAASKRAFNPFAISASVKILHPFTQKLSTDLQGAITFPGTNLQIGSATFGVNYQVPYHRMQVVPRLAMGLLQIDYQDKQPLPNHIRYNAAPFVQLGVTLIFN